MNTPQQRGRPRKPRPPGLPGQLGEAIEGRRKDRGLTAEQLGVLAGVGSGTVLALERGGRSPALDTILAIAHALGVSGVDLLAACAAWTERPKEKGKRHAATKTH